MRKSDSLEQLEAETWARELLGTALRPSERLRVTEWIGRKFGRLPIDFERFPWLREPGDAMADYRVEEQLLIAPPQVGKSLLAEGGICYFLVEDPGDLVAYTHTIPLSKTWAEQRVIPSIKRCQACHPFLPTDPRLIRTTEILMGHMVVEVAPANESSTQSRTRRIVICDERNLWDAGRADNARRRASSPDFDGRRKIINFGNAGFYEGEWEQQWRTSDQGVLCSRCPSCGQVAPFKFSEKKCRRVAPEKKFPGFTIEWEENKLTRPDGIWDLKEAVKTVRLCCPQCKDRFEDTARIRHLLRREMHYIPMNPGAGHSLRGWAVSGVATYRWADLFKQFTAANLQLDLGDMKPMSEFVMKGINEPWSEDVIFDSVSNPTGDYAMSGEAWEEASWAAMTIDVQEIEPYFWFVQRDWSTTGRSRLRRCGPANSWDELRSLQQAAQIPDRHVHVDAGYKPAEVYQKCAEWRWIALRGRDDESFIHSRGLKLPVRRYFSEPRVLDPAIGTDRQGDPRRARALEIMWANSPVKDILSRLYQGRASYFGIPKDVPQTYLAQMASERKQIVKTLGSQEIRRWMRQGKRPNHLWDCEAMQVVFALIMGPLRVLDQPAGAGTPAQAPG